MDTLDIARTEQAYQGAQDVRWMQDSGCWGVTYPISGDTLARLKNGKPAWPEEDQ